MPDCACSRERREILLMEDLRDEPHPLVKMEGLPIGATRGNARALLPAVLEGEKTVVGQKGSILVAVHGEDAALMFGTMGFGQGRLGGEGVDQVDNRALRECRIRFSSLRRLFKHHLENCTH